MRRPARTRRLSIAAMASLLAFTVVGSVYIGTFWHEIGWTDGNGKLIGVFDGCAYFSHTAAKYNLIVTRGRYSIHTYPDRHAIGTALWGFRATNVWLGDFTAEPFARAAGFEVNIPLWPLLLVLLIAPVRLLISRPANVPAFPVITKRP